MNIRRIITTSATVVFFAVTSVSPVFAETRAQVRQDIRDDIKQEVKMVKEDFKEKIASKVGAIKQVLGVRSSLGQATVTAINGAVLTVTKDSKTYTVNTGSFDKCTTQYRRRFWGSSSLSEISVNDKINVFGMWTDDAKSGVNACLIRDVSIQKRFGVFFGEVKSVSANGFVMSTVSEKRADQTVTVSSSTSIVNRKEQKIGQGDIVVGNKVRVSGMWDNQNNTVTEVRKVKDFSIPVVTTPTPKN